jgi:phosphatidate cytidylyltransferase
MLKQRVITSLVLLPMAVLAVWFNYPMPWFTLLAGAWGGLAAFEFFRLSGMSQAKPLLYFGTACTVLAIFARDSAFLPTAARYLSEDTSLAIIAVAVIAPLLWLLAKRRLDSVVHWAWMLAGIIYVGVLLGYFVALRNLSDGRNWVYLALFITFASDTAAFFVGRSIGKHKLAPAISPSKTWEGTVGGLLGAAVASLIFVPASIGSFVNPLHIDLQIVPMIILGLAVSVFGQLGDLVESMFKRALHAKDSGNILPGHGGVLDRLDSIAFAGIVVYYFVWLTR